MTSLEGIETEVRSPDLLRTALLWVHALSGLIWIGSCASLVLASLALAAGSDEARDFMLKAAPRIDRLNLSAAATLLVSGAVNLAIAGAVRNYAFSSGFVAVLCAKIGLFATMALALAASWRAEAMIDHDAPGATARMVKLSGLTVVSGTIAMVLGLWLLGA